MAHSHYRVIEWLCIYDQTVNGLRAPQADDERGCQWAQLSLGRDPGAGKGHHVKEHADVPESSATPNRIFPQS